jgi:FtsZ-binding cell division protein ZapB
MRWPTLATDDDDGFGVLIPLPGALHRKAQNERSQAFDDLTVRPKPFTGGKRECDHRRSWVDVRARRLFCRDCEVELDPIDVLGRLASRREHEVRTVLTLRYEIDRLTETKAKLEREERNAKSRIRNARKRRDDRDALIAAAVQFRSEAGVSRGIGGYRGWDELNDAQRERVIEYVRQIVEAYAGALPSEARVARGA